MEYLENKFFLLAFTFGVFFLSRVLQKKTGWVVLNPILLTIAVLILFLKFTGISYETYNEGGHLIEFWLKPAVVALGVPLYLQLEMIKKQLLPIVISQLAGCLVGLVAVVVIAKLLGATPEIICSLAPKSVTTPIAMEVSYPKGFCVLESGKIEKDIFFIKKGIVRAYTSVDGKEITFWVGKEGATLVSMKGYVNNEPGYETMELMEDSVLYVLERKKLKELFSEDLHIANWGRRYAEMELLATEERLISMLSAIASERYKELLEKEPDLLQRLPLGNIATYLGITQASLSRIRAQIK
jgi:CRP-like cAMP-binding protein